MGRALPKQQRLESKEPQIWGVGCVGRGATGADKHGRRFHAVTDSLRSNPRAFTPKQVISKEKEKAFRVKVMRGDKERGHLPMEKPRGGRAAG